jgi:hypothetical protein
MRTTLTFGGVIILLFLFNPSFSNACGDKFLVKGRAPKKGQCVLHSQKSTIILYKESSSPSVGKSLDEDLRQTLTDYGQDVRVVTSREELNNAIGSGSIDLVICGLASAEDVGRSLAAAGRQCAIVPVIDDNNEEQMVLAKEKFGAFIKATDRTNTKILKIGNALSDSGNKLQSSGS